MGAVAVEKSSAPESSDIGAEEAARFLGWPAPCGGGVARGGKGGGRFELSDKRWCSLPTRTGIAVVSTTELGGVPLDAEESALFRG